MLTNYTNFSLIHKKIKQLVLSIDFKVIKLNTWLDLQVGMLSGGKTSWDKIKEKNTQILINFPITIEEHVD